MRAGAGGALFCLRNEKKSHVLSITVWQENSRAAEEPRNLARLSPCETTMARRCAVLPTGFGRQSSGLGSFSVFCGRPVLSAVALVQGAPGPNRARVREQHATNLSLGQLDTGLGGAERRRAPLIAASL